MASFVHLRVKSAYSLLEGAVRPSEMVELARDAGTPAVAVTDTNNLFGVYEIADTLAKGGIQPIVGALLSVEVAAAASTRPDRARSRRMSPCWCRTRRATAISPSSCPPPIWTWKPATGRM